MKVEESYLQFRLLSIFQAFPKILIILFVAPIRETMMMITTSLACILDFVKEIVEDLSYNPNTPPVPSIFNKNR